MATSFEMLQDLHRQIVTEFLEIRFISRPAAAEFWSAMRPIVEVAQHSRPSEKESKVAVLTKEIEAQLEEEASPAVEIPLSGNKVFKSKRERS